MIFVTVGTQGPFERLIAAMDSIAKELPEIEFIAQVSEGSSNVKYMKAFDFVSPVEFNRYFTSADLIVSHAGMGTIISAFEGNKPILVLPKLKKFGEHRNDHQLATAKKLESLKYIQAAYDENELHQKVFDILGGNMSPLHRVGKYASSELINSLQRFIAI